LFLSVRRQLEHGSVLAVAAARRGAVEISLFVRQQHALRIGAVIIAAERVEYGFVAVRVDFVHDTAAVTIAAARETTLQRRAIETAGCVENQAGWQTSVRATSEGVEYCLRSIWRQLENGAFAQLGIT